MLSRIKGKRLLSQKIIQVTYSPDPQTAQLAIRSVSSRSDAGGCRSRRFLGFSVLGFRGPELFVPEHDNQEPPKCQKQRTIQTSLEILDPWALGRLGRTDYRKSLAIGSLG